MSALSKTIEIGSALANASSNGSESRPNSLYDDGVVQVSPEELKLGSRRYPLRDVTNFGLDVRRRWLILQVLIFVLGVLGLVAQEWLAGSILILIALLSGLVFRPVYAMKIRVRGSGTTCFIVKRKKRANQITKAIEQAQKRTT